MSRRPLLALLATLAAPSLFALAAPYANAPTCTTSWTAERVNGNDVWSDGDWADPDRWDNGVPTAADTACVVGPDDRSATFTVTSSQPREVGGLVVGSTRGNVNVNVRFDATMTVLGDGQLLGNDRIDGALTLGGTFTLDSGFLATRGGTVTVLGGGTLLVDRGDSGSNTNASQIGSRSSGSSPSTLVVGGRFEARESVTVQSELRVVAGVLAAVADDRSTQPVQTRVRFDNGGQIVAARLETEALSELFFDGAFTASGLIDGTADGETGFVRGGSLAVVGGGVTVLRRRHRRHRDRHLAVRPEPRVRRHDRRRRDREHGPGGVPQRSGGGAPRRHGPQPGRARDRRAGVPPGRLADHH